MTLAGPLCSTVCPLGVQMLDISNYMAAAKGRSRWSMSLIGGPIQERLLTLQTLRGQIYPCHLTILTDNAFPVLGTDKTSPCDKMDLRQT